MTTVSELNVYPVKSMRGVPMQSVELWPTGFAWDRQWMTVDATESFVTQRTHPQLARIQPSLDAESLTLHAEGFPALRVPLETLGAPLSVQVWRDTCSARDQGDAAAEWLSGVVGDALRLVRVAPEMQRRADAKFTGPDATPVSFVDGYPILVCNSASLDELNARMATPVPMTRFRPNIVLEGLPAFEEDRIAALCIDQVTLRLVKPCLRCVITSTDQQTGQRSTNPLPVLRKFRFNRELLGVAFGENAVIAAGVGQTLVRGARCRVQLESVGAQGGGLAAARRAD